jgi:hypothetical protein
MDTILQDRHASVSGRMREVDYQSRDGKWVANLEKKIQGVRAFYSAVMRLVIYLERNPAVEKGCVVLRGTRMSRERVQHEWGTIKSALRPAVVRRLGIVMEGQTAWFEPDVPAIRQMASSFPKIDVAQKPIGRMPRQSGRKVNEVVKVLLGRWLLKQGPISMGELSRQVGCSYPTLRSALERTSLQRHLAFTSSRSVELKNFPHDAWRELVVLSNSQRGSVRFRDRSGELTPQRLLAKIERIKPSGTALGGVMAARYWQPDFNLNGLPRVDLIAHAGQDDLDLQWVRKLDPALTQTTSLSDPAIFVVHPLHRSAPLFTQGRKSSFPVADPVETALDLAEMSLSPQANQMLTRLRPEVRLA